MKLTKQTATLLLVIGVYMLFTWTTRLYTWYANDLQESPYAALIHADSPQSHGHRRLPRTRRREGRRDARVI